MLVIGLEGTQRAAQQLADMLVPGDCVSFRGDLGAGKTTMIQTLISHLHGGDIAIISPSFTLLQTYDVTLLGEPCTIWHYDLYRLEDEAELQELALEEAFEDGVALIEWPEIAWRFLPEHTIHVAIEFGEDSDNRDIRITSSEANRERLLRAGLLA